MVYQIPGCPIPLARARFNGRRVYDEQKNLKLYFRNIISHQHGANKLFSGPLKLQATFYMTMPKKAKFLAGRYHIFKPDLDNLLKMLCDLCGEDLLFGNDCVICSIETKKVYDANPRTEFIIEELKND